jgi:rhomboid family GlyGly-CTERM serine protease
MLQGSLMALSSSLTNWINSWVNKEGLSLYLLAVACLLLAPWSEVGMQVFAMDRSSIEAGEYWRIWTGQLVHSSWTHLWLNLLGLAVLQQIFGDELTTLNWLWGCAVIALLIGTSWMAFSDASWLPFASRDYVVGLSALLHGLFAYAACLAMRRDSLLAGGALLIIGGKVVWEQVNGPSEFTAGLIDIPVASDVHLYGFAAGLLLGVAMTVRR